MFLKLVHMYVCKYIQYIHEYFANMIHIYILSCFTMKFLIHLYTYVCINAFYLQNPPMYICKQYVCRFHFYISGVWLYCTHCIVYIFNIVKSCNPYIRVILSKVSDIHKYVHICMLLLYYIAIYYKTHT